MATNGSTSWRHVLSLHLYHACLVLVNRSSSAVRLSNSLYDNTRERLSAVLSWPRLGAHCSCYLSLLLLVVSAADPSTCE